MSVVNAIPLIAAGDDGYNLTRSLRFRSSASAYLNRTMTTPTNQKIWTWSAWVKLGAYTTSYNPLFAAGASGSAYSTVWFNSNSLVIYSYTGATSYWLQTTQVFRDYSAWQHIVISVDTTQATSSNRIKLYVNGVQVTAFSIATYPSLNYNDYINSAVAHYIGQYTPALGSIYFDGYLAEVNFIDGQALDPSSFGAYSIYNQWLPKKYAGTYGTNGFYLPFTNNASAATLGNDFSGNGNTWTTNNISVTAGSTYDSMTDVPTLTSATAANYCVMNPLDNSSTTITNGNLQLVGSSATWCTTRSTFVLPNGSWYMELTATSGTGNGNSFVGLAHQSTAISTISGGTFVGGTSTSYAYSSNGNIYNNGSVLTATGVTWASGSVIGISYDGSSLKFYKNNTLVTTVSSLSYTNNYCITTSFYSSDAGALNFGQQPFVYTPPSGFLALNTFNL